jgi:hypothetical protein
VGPFWFGLVGAVNERFFDKPATADLGARNASDPGIARMKNMP